MSGDWSDNYDNRFGVDPFDYQYEDDFISARMSARGDFDPSNGKKEGCYIATCIYGSYDCPEVLVLRRFRDTTLKSTMLGHAFIRFYYAVSPKLVLLLGNKRWFKAAFRKPLNALVSRLKEQSLK